MSGTEYYELKMKADILIFLVGLDWGLRARTIGMGGGGHRGAVFSFSSIPRAREADRGGQKRLCGGLGSRISGDSSFCTTNYFTFFFPRGNFETKRNGGKV